MPTLPFVFARRQGITSREVRYRGASLIRNRHLVGPYSRTMPRLLWWSYGGGRFLMSEVPLY